MAEANTNQEGSSAEEKPQPAELTGQTQHATSAVEQSETAGEAATDSQNDDNQVTKLLTSLRSMFYCIR